MFDWLFLLISYLPFQIALNPSDGFDLASLRVFILILFFFWLIKKKSSFPLYNIQALGLIFFLLLSGISLFGAEHFSWGVRKMVYFLSIFPLYFLTVNLVNSFEKVKKIVLALITSGFIIALIGFFQFVFQFVFSLEKVYSFWLMNILPVFSGFNLGAMIMAYPSWLVNIKGETIMRAFSLFSDPHIFSFYLGLLFPLLICLKKRKLFISSYFLFLIGISLSFSRGAYLALIISFIFLAFLSWKYLDRKGISWLLLASLLIFIIPITPISDRFYSTFNLSEGSNQGRLEMWEQASQTGLNNFWQGVGLGNYSSSIRTDFGYRNPVTAHNLYLDIFSEMGVFALIVWLILIFGTIGYLFERIKEIDFEKKCYLIALAGSLVYLSVHSFFETPLYSPVVLSILMILFGLSTYFLKEND